MGKGRLEAFSDGVVAILITIMVLELRAPGGTALSDLRPLFPVLTAYALSFVYLAIYWNNHHHMLQAAETVDGRILWANMHLLFWLSLVPFTTAWLGATGAAPAPTALYGAVLLMAGIAYFILARSLKRHHGASSRLSRAIGADGKGLGSIAAYAAAVPLAFFSPPLACGIYVAVACVWLVPDRRFEKGA
jgi:uncharacterized membrane protein